MENKLKTSLARSCSGRVLLRIILAYLFCSLFNPFFFSGHGVAGTLAIQVYGCALAFCFLYLCAKTKYIGLPLYLLLCSFFSGLSVANFAFGYDFESDLVTAIMETNATEASAFFTFAFISSFCAFVLAAWGILFAFSKLSRPAEQTSRKHRLICYCAAAAGLFVSYLFPTVVLFKIPWGGINVPELAVNTFADNSIRWYPFFHSLPGESSHDGSSANSGKPSADLNREAPYDSFFNHYRRPLSNLGTLYKGIRNYLTPIPITDTSIANSKELDPHQDFICVLAIGESIRADHLGLNGYSRNTTPQLAKVPNLLVFPHMFSYGASTDPSFRGIMTGQLAANQTTMRTAFTSILKKHGYHCTYCAENTGDMTRTGKNRHIIGNYVDTWLPLSGTVDHILSEWRHALPTEGKHCIILQNGTGHYPYAHDSNFSAFTGGIKLVDNYDNCILALDAMYSGIIASLADKNAVLLYCSDHGELLGENGKWHHGDDNDPILRRVAAFIWFSDTFIANNKELVEAISKQKDAPLCHGQLYATILRLCRISTEAQLEIGDIATDSLLSHPENNLPITVKEELLKNQTLEPKGHE